MRRQDPARHENSNDQFFWDVEGWLAEGEYRGIVARLTNGEIDSLMAGMWPKACEHAPFGYVADGTTVSGLSFDPECFPALWRLIELAARPASEMPNESIAEELGGTRNRVDRRDVQGQGSSTTPGASRCPRRRRTPIDY